MRLSSSIVVLALAAALPAGARADGAFPDAQQVLLPADRPHQILVGTNFGLLVSNDDGAHWDWICEEVIGPLARLFQAGPPPADRILAISSNGVDSSIDQGCTWTVATGGFVQANNAVDVFADPNDDTKVFAIGQVTLAGGYQHGIYRSDDGGQTFADTPLALSAKNGAFTGVESARSDGNVLYAALFEAGPALLRSSDGGAHFDRYDVVGGIDQSIYLAAVDPVNANRLYLRVAGPPEHLAISDDGGRNLRLALTLPSFMTAFLRRADGTLLVGGSDGKSYRSSDDGQSFGPWADGPHLRGLGERGGTVYAATSQLLDGYAVAATSDDGKSWQTLLRLADIRGPAACVRQACEDPWRVLRATLDAAGDGGVAPADLATASEPRADGGCACALAATSDPAPAAALTFLLLLSAALAVRSSRRP